MKFRGRWEGVIVAAAFAAALGGYLWVSMETGSGSGGPDPVATSLDSHFRVPDHVENSFQAPIGFEFVFDLVSLAPKTAVTIVEIEIPPESGFSLEGEHIAGESVEGANAPEVELSGAQLGAGDVVSLDLKMRVADAGRQPSSRIDSLTVVYRTSGGTTFATEYPITLVVCHGDLGAAPCPID